MSNQNKMDPETPFVIVFLLLFVSVALTVKGCLTKPISYNGYDDYDDEDAQQLPYSAP